MSLTVTSESNPKTAASVILPFWNFIAIVFLLACLFYLLTSGIPLGQLGLAEVAISKKVSTRMTRYAVLGLFGIVALWKWRWPALFNELFIVKAVKKAVCRFSEAMVAALFLIYTAALSAVGFLRQAALETRAFDLGIFAQAVWNTLHGDFLYSSIKGGICLLGDHVSPLLAALAPAYALWPDPRTLVLLQVIAAASCMFPIYYLAKGKTASTVMALVFVVAYAFYLPTRAALHEDFHPEVLAEPFLLLAFIFLEKKKIFPFLLCLLTAISSKENMLGVSFMFGFYAFVWKKMRGLGLFLMIVSAALFAASVFWLVPYLSGGLYLYRGNYDQVLSHPVSGILRSLLNLDALEYALKIFSPFLFLPFLHLPTLMLTFPVLFQNMISENPVMRSFGYHYTTGLTPFVFISAIYGFSVLKEKLRWVQSHELLVGILFLFVALLRSGPSEYFYYADTLSHLSAHRHIVRERLKVIPEGVSVLTHNNFIPQMANRKFIYQFDYASPPTKGETAVKLSVDYVIFDREFWEPGTPPLEDTLAELLKAGYYVSDRAKDFYVMKK